MKLYAAGFNAWNQLRFRSQAGSGAAATGRGDLDPDDVTAFVCVLEDDEIDNLQPHLSYTAVTTSKGRLLTGMPPAAVVAEAVDGAYAENLKGHVVVHDEGRVLQYPTVDDYLISSLETRSDQQAMCTVLDVPRSAKIVQVVAYDAGFAALAADGRVFTWGDPRFPECLGRDGNSPSDDPAPIPFFDDLPTGPVVALAAGGYMLAARTHGHDLYCWGGYAGRPTRVLPDLTGDPTPIIVGVGDNEDGLDIASVGVGEEHMIVLAIDGSVCVRGSNANGQLGLGDVGGEQGSASWQRVDNLGLGVSERVVAVAAGPQSSFILVGDAVG